MLVLHVIAVGIVVYDHIDRALFADDTNGGSTITGETCWSSDPSGVKIISRHIVCHLE